MNKLTEKEKKICDKYRKRGSDGLVHCYECPLVKNKYEYLCKANAVYNRHTKKWELNLDKE